MKNHIRTAHPAVTASVPVKVLFRAIATKKLIHEKQTTLTFPLTAEHLQLLDAARQQTGMPVSDILFHFVAQQLSNAFHAKGSEIEVFRHQHGEYETVVEPNGAIEIHRGEPKH